MGVAIEATDDEEYYIVTNITLAPFACPILVFVRSFIGRALLYSIESFLASKLVSTCQLMLNNP